MIPLCVVNTTATTTTTTLPEITLCSVPTLSLSIGRCVCVSRDSRSTLFEDRHL